MAGLAAAAEARRLGARPLVLERRHRPGGSMLLSSGVIWRHRRFADFRSECARGQESLQRLVFGRLDEDLRWLEALGAPVVARGTGNPRTTGVRFDPIGLTRTLAAAAGGVRTGERLLEPPARRPLVLATGGFAANRQLLRRYVSPHAAEALLRAAPGGTGDGLRIGLMAGAGASAGLDEVYARAMPAPPARPAEGDLVRLSQLYARYAEVTSASGEPYTPASWSETDVAQWMLRQPGARACFRVGRGSLSERVRDRTVGEMIEAAAAAGAPVRRDREHVAVETVAGVTTTLGGLRIDSRACAAPALFACGADAGGVATGGYASGLAAALVFGRIAARAALAEPT
jgi:fumarate reductase flavoprotein subunit